VICDGTDCRIASRTDFQNSVLKNIANGSNPLDGVNKQQIDAVLAAAQAYTDATAFASASLPGQAGNAGKYLTTDGSNTSWASVLPSFTSTVDYTLTSDGSSAVWSSPATMRTKLSLGGAALLNVGTTVGTVAAGNDSRIVGAAQLSGAVFSGAISGPSAVFTSFTGALTGNAATATAWATARDLSLTGDATATLTGVNGSANVSAALTLAATGVSAGTYSGLTVDAKGRVTAATAAVASFRATATITGSSGAVTAGTGISCVRNSTGDYTITLSPAMASADYLPIITLVDGSVAVYAPTIGSISTTGFTLETFRDAGGVISSYDFVTIRIAIVL
jgi:hypothetical protein